MTRFEDLNLLPELLRAVAAENYTEPTPIQTQAIPIVLEGRDLLGCAQTGTGKTAAFALPILQKLFASKQADHAAGRNRPGHIRALILSPTRELASQIGDSFSTYGKYTGLFHTVVFGGVRQGNQVNALKRGVDILVATPGRLMDLMYQGHIDIRKVEIFVLDEADRMLDMGFIADIRKIIGKLPKEHQTLFFSATMPMDIQRLANDILVDPARVEVTPVSSTTELVDQYVYIVEKSQKRSLLIHLLSQLTEHRILIFTRSKIRADVLVRHLRSAKFTAEAIHSDKTQSARQNALNNFKSGLTGILVATDIASRGIDVDNITHVINFDLPNEPETYVHRIGRTGRASATGTALSFCDSEELFYLADIEQIIEKHIPVVMDHPFQLDYDAPPPPNSGSFKRNKNASGGGGGGKGRPSNKATSLQARAKNKRKQTKKDTKHSSV